MAEETLSLERLKEQVQSQQLLAEYNALLAHNRLAEFQNRQILESFNQPIDPREQYYDHPDFYPLSTNINAPYYFTQVDDRHSGQFRPVFEKEHDLDVIRAQTNRIVWFDEVGIGALGSLKNYIFQDGLKYVPAAQGEFPEAVLTEMNELIDHILRHNCYWDGLDHEYHDRARVDGEVLTELLWEDGDVRWHEHEPQYLTEPNGPSKRNLEDWETISNRFFGVSDWKFGVHTPKSEPAKCLGYHLIFNKEGTEWDYVPEERMVHYKRNVYRNVKRGIPDFFQVVRDLERDGKLVEALALGGAMQASIPWVVQYPEGAKTSSIQSAVLGTADYTRNVQKESGSTTVAVHKIRPGSIPHMKRGAEYVEGPMAKGTPRFIEISQHIRRTIGVRFCMPEFMISGDASNANYSSSSVHADAFVKAREEDQRCFGYHGVMLLWKSLKMYHQRGRFAAGMDWEEIKRRVRIVPDGKDPSTKSPLEKRQALQIEVDYGWTSDETAATECGRHYDEEVSKGAKRAPSPNMQAEQAMKGVQEALKEAWRGGY